MKKDIFVNTTLSFGPFNNVSMTLVSEENPLHDIISEDSDNEAVADCDIDR